jgi:hydrogenase expression/formation protein HypD
MVSGPGCPVCITPDAVHEAAIALVTGRPNLILATFGDMTRVPTARGSLRSAVPAPGSEVKVVYSPTEAVAAAAAQPGKEVVFFGAGFETTIPSIAHSVREAKRQRLKNLSLLPALRVIPPPLRALLEAGETIIQGFLYPGHVSAIIGLKPYAFIPRDYGIPGAVTGFEPADILLGVRSVLEQIQAGRPEVALVYARAVRPAGNPAAQIVMREVLEPADAAWRGMGVLPASGLVLRKAYAAFDAELKFGLRLDGREDRPTGCRCGDVLRGVIPPRSCPLFGRRCTPDRPLGPCMVSFEGACLIHFKYGPVKEARHA